MLGRTIAIAVSAAVLAGCVSPAVRPNPLTFQNRATNVADWQSLAKRTVAAIPRSNTATGVYVEESPTDSRFAVVYRRFLQQELYAQNYAVLRTPRGADIVLRTDTDWVLHDKAGKRIQDYATLWTAANALGGQFRHISSVDTGYAASIATGALIDFLASLNGGTRAEVVVTSSIITARTDNLHFVRSETVYVEPSELPYYMNSMASVSLPVVRSSND